MLVVGASTPPRCGPASAEGMNGLMAAPGGEVCPAVLPTPFRGLGDDITSNSVVCCVYKLPPHHKHSAALLPGAQEDVRWPGQLGVRRGPYRARLLRCRARPVAHASALQPLAPSLPCARPRSQEPVVTDADLPDEQPLWHAAPRRGGGPHHGGPPRAMLGDPAHRMLHHSMQLGRQFPGAGVQPGYAPGGFHPGPPQQQQQFGFQPGPPQQGYGFQPAPMQQQFGMRPPQHGFQQPPAMQQQQQFGGGGYGQPRHGAKFTGGSFGGPPPMQSAGFGFSPAPPTFQPGMQQGQFGAPPGFGQQPGYGQQAPPAFGAPPQQPYGQPPPQQFYGQPPQQPQGPPQGGYAQGNRFAALQRPRRQ